MTNMRAFLLETIDNVHTALYPCVYIDLQRFHALKLNNKYGYVLVDTYNTVRQCRPVMNCAQASGYGWQNPC